MLACRLNINSWQTIVIALLPKHGTIRDRDGGEKKMVKKYGDEPTSDKWIVELVFG